MAQGYGLWGMIGALRSARQPVEETSAEPWVQHWQMEWQRPDTWPAPKEVPPPSPGAQHVVLPTEFDEPWDTICRGLKEILVERGCTVYNPHTDNKEPGPGTLRSYLSFSKVTF